MVYHDVARLVDRSKIHTDTFSARDTLGLLPRSFFNVLCSTVVLDTLMCSVSVRSSISVPVFVMMGRDRFGSFWSEGSSHCTVPGLRCDVAVLLIFEFLAYCEDQEGAEIEHHASVYRRLQSVLRREWNR